jgi:hypothetical protein
MTITNVAPRLDADDTSLYQAIARDPRYGHYSRIPERVCRAMERFGVAFDRVAVLERLRSYYLFIGVADDACDAGRVEAGELILAQLINGLPSFDEAEGRSASSLAIVALRQHIGEEVSPAFMARLRELYGAVVRERRAETMPDYIEQRKAVGRLTAEASYLLIRPLLNEEREDMRRFFRQVGEVGCLLDSVIDLGSDTRLGLLNFRPTLKGQLQLAVHTLREGLQALAQHPRLCGLFLEAAGDTLLDRLRAAPPTLETANETERARMRERAA